MPTMATEPKAFLIGTAKAFERNYAYKYARKYVAGECIYVCEKGSQFSKTDEFLVIRNEDGYWTAWDSLLLVGLQQKLLCRQAIFRSADDILQAGWHQWDTNHNANDSDDASADPVWHNDLRAETRHIA